MSEFTNGPWHLNTTTFDGKPVGWEVVGREEGSINPIIIGMLKCSPSKPISKNIKDAQLIAAAPDMLEALEAIKKDLLDRANLDSDNMKVVECSDSVWVQLQEAIAKARYAPPVSA